MGSQEFVRAGVGLGCGLGGMVVSAVGYRSQGIPPALHRGLPSPYLTLIFSLDGPVVGGVTPEQARGPDAARTEIVVGGLHQRPAYIVQPGSEAGVQLAVHPLAARTLLGLPAGALASDDDLVTSGAEVLGKRAAEIRERLCEQRAWADRFATLGAYLRERAAEGEDGAPVRSEVGEAWAWLARHRGAGTLAGLAEHVSLSPRRLTSVFQAETGLSPKQAARLMRFQHARNTVVRAVAAGRAPDLARVAADCGYFDHSHLVRDFRQYTGVSPTAWLAEECRNIQAGGHLYGEE
ncbi:helix-turn-helix domain-containing protein [Streptomyces violaceusniger]|uniref:Putative transcriptional regulator, AraC n=1 Tax=Streptomyces violaceusniger TaxID=68280 RepID=A0A4D4KUT6_STRVO|nr:putative transcriptional regulator, AraC [Streptomyces violaceusniger]